MTSQVQWKKLRFLTSPTINEERRALLASMSQVTFLPMESVGEKGELDLSNVRELGDVLSGYTMFFDGDVLVAKITPCFENGKGAFVNGLLGGVGFGSTEFHVLTPSHDVDGRYLYYVTVSHPFRKLGEASMTGAAGQKRVTEEFVRNFRLPLPSLDEQCAIAQFLDRETVRLDSLVAAKERMLRLLAEKRRALITLAVTRGIDPDVRLRDSGMVSLHSTPAHWDVTRLKFLLTAPPTYGANEAALEDNQSFPRFVRITDIEPQGTLRDDTFKSLPPELAKPYLLEDGDVLFARSGATVGKAFIYSPSWGVACFAGYLIRCRCDPSKLLPEFLFAYAQAEPYWLQVRESTIQATIQNFSAERYGNLTVPVPSIYEQKEIVAHIRAEVAKLDAVRVSTEYTISLLKERRAALIAAAVTGQLALPELSEQVPSEEEMACSSTT